MLKGRGNAVVTQSLREVELKPMKKRELELDVWSEVEEREADCRLQ